MLVKSLAALLAVAGLAAAQASNSTNTTYTTGKAVITGVVNATFTFKADPSGGMQVGVNVTGGLPPQAGGYQYHVHVNPTGTPANCTATGAHLDPAMVGTAVPCNPANLTSCQTGDLSGKHGNLNGTDDDGSVTYFEYKDTQLSFTGAGPLLGRSVVIHNGTVRLACADLVVEGYVVPPANTSSTNSTAGTPNKTSSASAMKVVGSLALSGVVAIAMLAL